MVKAAVAKAQEIATEFQQRMLTEEWTRQQALEAARQLPKAEELMPPVTPQKLHEIARQEHNHGLRHGYWPELQFGEQEGPPLTPLLNPAADDAHDAA